MATIFGWKMTTLSFIFYIFSCFIYLVKEKQRHGHENQYPITSILK
jgi:hypothetical protein